MDIVAVVLLGWARSLPSGPRPEARWSRTGVIMVAGSLLLISAAVWLAAVP
ncbi:hypothetical protein GCM10010191_25300 [Actinomadura vinacea]|uniref:Uncharacterized protein n=2 Tax=Actinomadura vinacea TaxID=115336 RepID=A0ABN3IWL3_9ACTN